MPVVLFHSVFQDLEAWYQDIQSRLQPIPDPSYKLKYTPTCTAIQQLQVYNRPTANLLWSSFMVTVSLQTAYTDFTPHLYFRWS